MFNGVKLKLGLWKVSRDKDILKHKQFPIGAVCFNDLTREVNKK